MRVLLDARMDVGGVGRYAADLRDGLSSIGSGLVVHVVGPTSRNILGGPFTPWGRMFVARRVQHEDIDLLHGLHFELPRSVNVPCVVTMPDSIPLDHPTTMPNPIRRMYFESVVRQAARRAEAVITPSRSSAAALVRHGVPEEKVTVIPLGVGEAFSSGSDEEVRQARERFSKGSRYVAVCADDRPHKNLDVLLDVARALAPETKVLCRGGSNRKLPGITFLRRLSDDELRLFYVGADALVVPSLVEGFGLPVLEALACGTPVVSGPNVGALDHVGDAVVVVDVCSAQEIVEGIRSVTGHSTSLSTHPGPDAVRSLTTAEMTRATYSLYQQVLS